MEQIALIADIHGNLPALEAVLADIDARGIARIFCLGDMVGKGPHSAQVLDILRSRCERIVRGNWEDAVLGQAFYSACYTHEQLGPERLSWLADLPYGIFLQLSGKSVKLYHGRTTIPEIVLPDAPREKVLAALDALDDQSDIVGFADVHVPFVRMTGGRMLFNTGAVGNPCDRIVQSSYAILRGISGSGEGSVSVELVRVPYDVERTLAFARDCGNLPFLEEYIKEIRTAVYQERRYYKASADPT